MNLKPQRRRVSFQWRTGMGVGHASERRAHQNRRRHRRPTPPKRILTSFLLSLSSVEMTWLEESTFKIALINTRAQQSTETTDRDRPRRRRTHAHKVARTHNSRDPQRYYCHHKHCVATKMLLDCARVRARPQAARRAHVLMRAETAQGKIRERAHTADARTINHHQTNTNPLQTNSPMI